MGSSPYRPKWVFYMVSERVMFPRTHVGSHHARFDFELRPSVELDASLAFVPPCLSTEEDARLGSVVKGGCLRHVMGSSPYRPKWVFYMVSERVMFPRTHVGSHHARFDFELRPSVELDASLAFVPPCLSTEEDARLGSVVKGGCLRHVSITMQKSGGVIALFILYTEGPILTSSKKKYNTLIWVGGPEPVGEGD
ncbi:hypothetical protein CRG98_046235 [Punica granatum]|uniref:Uncharacterized protein n=1 Tax=Punica granatum TaxID=22663 RepID=A0A2I0HNR3_PUNGR|nr:hypothetical protein CRG98_046235 [Punica granatum]